MTEGLVLTSLAGILGLAGAHGTVRLLLSLIPLDKASRMPFLFDLSIFNLRVLGFASVMGLFALALFSLTPALRLSL
jgi:hypothetical protein